MIIYFADEGEADADGNQSGESKRQKVKKLGNKAAKPIDNDTTRTATKTVTRSKDNDDLLTFSNLRRAT